VAPTELERIEQERADLEMLLQEAMNEKRIDENEIISLKHQIMHLDNLAEIEDPAIKSKAIEVLRNGDPVDYMIRVIIGFMWETPR
jgi:hypothetical protein